ncbi:DNA polymerase III alpha subunit [Cryobacterium roopkundense]|uniref:DNA polymerase III alpha subunit n=1 Tax=Cryobacterium roopkundense TaxID=1001240 RepID=A0A7W8ZXE9_9MICO|nr:DNA polymerase III alpha subunit [Cryobacterium roopkundense]
MSMTNAYRGRGAVRDAGLALGMPEEQVAAIAKQMWRFNARDFRQAVEEKPELAELAAQVRESPQLDQLVHLTEKLDRLPRHISVHPCGVILSDASLLDRTPVQRSGMGLPISQFDKHDMDPMGLIKLDILGVRMHRPWPTPSKSTGNSTAKPSTTTESPSKTNPPTRCCAPRAPWASSSSNPPAKWN